MKTKLYTKLILIYIVIIGSIFTFLVPPFQKPDEQIHFFKALTISNGNIVCTKKSGNIGYIQKQFYQLLRNKTYINLIKSKNARLQFSAYLHTVISDRIDTKPVLVLLDQICDFPALSYLPLSAGLLLGHIFHVNAHISFLLGRLTLFVTATIWFWYLLKKTPKEFQPILLFVFCLPMTLHQITGYSYDGIHICAALTLFVLIIKTFYLEKITLRYFLLLFTITELFLFSKIGGYELFPLFLFFVPLNKIHLNWKKALTIITLLISFIFITYFLGKLYMPSPFNDKTLPPRVNLYLQTKILLSHPLSVIPLTAKTTIHHLGNYIMGTIGIFGWSNYRLSYFDYLLYIGIFLFLVLKINLPQKLKITLPLFVLQTLLLLGGYIYLLLIFYLIWTPLRDRIVDGVQGRYFIVYIPFLYLWFLQLKIRVTTTYTFSLPNNYIANSLISMLLMTGYVYINLIMLIIVYSRFFIISSL